MACYVEALCGHGERGKELGLRFLRLNPREKTG